MLILLKGLDKIDLMCGYGGGAASMVAFKGTMSRRWLLLKGQCQAKI